MKTILIIIAILDIIYFYRKMHPTTLAQMNVQKGLGRGMSQAEYTAYSNAYHAKQANAAQQANIRANNEAYWNSFYNDIEMSYFL